MKLQPDALSAVIESLQSEATQRARDATRAECDCMTCEFCRVAEDCPHIREVAFGMAIILLRRLAEVGPEGHILMAQTKAMDFLAYGFEIGVAYSESQRLKDLCRGQV